MQVNFLNVEYFFQKAYDLLGAGDFRGILYLLLASLSSLLDTIAPISFLISVICIAGTVYCSIRLSQIRKAERELLRPAPVAGVNRGFINHKWERVIQHINSDLESDWRLAILEADIMLDEMMEAQGYRQDTLGDKLKAVEKSDFTNIDLAWEAHLVRNDIAHKGAAFVLTHREAKRVIGLYEKVFREFRYI